MPNLHYFAARQHVADLIAAAERDRTARAGRPTLGLAARAIARFRLRSSGPPAAKSPSRRQAEPYVDPYAPPWDARGY